MRAEQGPSVNPSSLTEADIDRLTTWKWKYSLEANGFTSKQAEHLLFMRWGAHHGVIGQEDTSVPVNAKTIYEVGLGVGPSSPVSEQTHKPTEHIVVGGDKETYGEAHKPTQEQVDAFEQWLREHGRAS